MSAYEFKTKPYQHQKDALKAGWNREGFAYFMEMGTGKTKTAVDNFSILYERGEVEVVLITSNKGSYANWQKREIPLHCPIEDAMVHLWRGGHTKHEFLALESLMVPCGKLRVLVMNIEALSNKNGKAMVIAEKFLSTGKAMMIVDESTTIKNSAAQRTKNVLRLSSLAKYRRVLTGSPVTQSPLDLYSQMSFAVPGLLGTSFYSFRAKYAVMQRKNFGGREVPIVVGFQNLDALAEKIKAHMFRVTKEQCLDLPPKVYTSREVELTEEQTKLYEAMKRKAYILLEDSDAEVSAMAVISQILKLHQIVCGHIVDDLGVLHDVPNNRIAELLQVVEETSGSVIIWANYRHDVDMICRALGEAYGTHNVLQYDGSIDMERRERAVETFQSKRARFFVGTVATGGFGITLTAATTVIYYSNSYDLERRIQSEDRAHRIGQGSSVTYVDLICPGTVDEKIIQVLRQKMNMAALLTGDTWKQWLI